MFTRFVGVGTALCLLSLVLVAGGCNRNSEDKAQAPKLDVNELAALQSLLPVLRSDAQNAPNVPDENHRGAEDTLTRLRALDRQEAAEYVKRQEKMAEEDRRRLEGTSKQPERYHEKNADEYAKQQKEREEEEDRLERIEEAQDRLGDDKAP